MNPPGNPFTSLHRRLACAWAAVGVLASLFVAGARVARAHEGPEEEIAELTERIHMHRDAPDLLIQRATEYKVLGKFAEAAKDLETALTLKEESVTARRELSQTYFALGKTNEALEVVNRALKSPADAEERAGLLMVRAGVLRARRDHAKALQDADEAIRIYPRNVEWYFFRSQVQAHLKRLSERVKGLEDGIRETGSGMLHSEWVEALMAAGDWTPAETVIDRELGETRWKASWLIRRARLHQARGDVPGAKADLGDALEELNQRLGSLVPDALLLFDRGLAHELLGRNEDALRDYRSARDKGLNDEDVEERIRRLAKADAAATAK